MAVAFCKRMSLVAYNLFLNIRLLRHQKPQMNTTATTGISDGAAPVCHQQQRLPIGCQPTSTAPVYVCPR